MLNHSPEGWATFPLNGINTFEYIPMFSYLTPKLKYAYIPIKADIKHHQEPIAPFIKYLISNIIAQKNTIIFQLGYKIRIANKNNSHNFNSLSPHTGDEK